MYQRRTYGLPILLAACLVGPMKPAAASVKLITLPPRERVEVQLDSPNVTLVEEERLVPLSAGVNEVVFGWANANIDKESIQFRCLTDPENIQVLSVSYPPGENALTWQVASPNAISARVRISYIIRRLDRSFAYRAVAAHDEQTLTLRQYIQLHNNANEEFGMAGMWSGFGERFERPIGIQETKRLLVTKFTNVAIRKTYTADLAAFGYLDPAKNQLHVPMHYVLINDEANGLGRFPLQPGKVRIFQDDGYGTLAFLGEDWGGFTPRDDEMKLFLGHAKDVVVKRTIDRRNKVRVLGNLYNYDVIVKYEIENFKDQGVVLDLVESIAALRREILGNTGRDVEWAFGDQGTLALMRNTEKSTAEKVVFNVPLPPRGANQKAAKQVHTLHLVIKNEW
ncbi:MAG: hypothetical protein ACE5E5_16185 [Phycisphaerae bacterium]